MMTQANNLRVQRVAAIALALLVPRCVFVVAQERTPNPLSFQQEGMTFHAELVRALTADNRVEVARLSKYPLKVNVVGLEKPVFVKNADAMAGLYRQFFSPGNRCAIELSRTPVAGADLPRHKLLLADGVVSIDSGRLIAERTESGLKITRMTVPLEAPARHPTPRVVTFVDERNQAGYMGRLAYDDLDAYVVSVKQGQRLHVRIDRFPGSALSLQVLENATGKVDGQQ